MNFKPKRSLGQNFLKDPWVIQEIIKSINLQPQQAVIEIGPGFGAITEFILAKQVNLIAIELDQILCKKLTTKFAAAIALGQLCLIHKDVLKVDLAAIMQAQKFKIVGNLPYQISTPLLFKLFACSNTIIDLHFLVQKELAERLIAGPGRKEYGRLSIMAQYWGKIELLLEVAPEAFQPVPKVRSTLIKLVPYTVLPYQAENFTQFAKLVTLAFCYRRKSIARIFKAFCATSDLENLAIDPQARPEQLTIFDFVRLSNFCKAWPNAS